MYGLLSASSEDLIPVFSVFSAASAVSAAALSASVAFFRSFPFSLTSVQNSLSAWFPPESRLFSFFLLPKDP